MRAVDYGRGGSGWREKFKPFRNSDIILTRTWYDVDDSTPYIPFVNCFMSAQTDPRGWTNEGPGAIAGFPKRVPGKVIDTYSGRLCGDLDQWKHGAIYDPDREYFRDTNGVLGCCVGRQFWCVDSTEISGSYWCVETSEEQDSYWCVENETNESAWFCVESSETNAGYWCIEETEVSGAYWCCDVFSGSDPMGMFQPEDWEYEAITPIMEGYSSVTFNNEWKSENNGTNVFLRNERGSTKLRHSNKRAIRCGS